MNEDQEKRSKEIDRKFAEAHWMIDQIPGWRVGEALEVIQQTFFPPPRREPGRLPSFVGMIRSGDPDAAENAIRRLYGEEETGRTGKDPEK